MENQVMHALEHSNDDVRFEMDGRGYTRVIPNQAWLERIEKHLACEMSLAEEEYRPIYDDAAKNTETYKATATADMPDGKKALMPAPLARIAVDQYRSWISNMIRRPRFMFSFEPYFKDGYEILIPLDDEMRSEMLSKMQEQMQGMMGGGQMMAGGGMSGGMGAGDMGGGMMGGEMMQHHPQMMQMMQMMQAAQSAPGLVTTETAEEVSKNLQAAYDFIVREGTNAHQVIDDAVLDALVVTRGYSKVCYETRDVFIRKPKKKGPYIEDLKSYDGSFQKVGSVRWYGVPFTSMLKRVHEVDLDEAEWIAEELWPSCEEFTRKAENGEWFLVPEKKEGRDAWAAACSVDTESAQAKERIEVNTQNRRSQRANCVPMREVWFKYYLPVAEQVPDPEDPTGVATVSKATVKCVSLFGQWHRGKQKLCSLYQNYRTDQRRPYAVVHQMKDAHSDTGASTTSISAFFQKAVTYLLQAEIKNAQLANNFGFSYVPESPAASVFAHGMVIEPGAAQPVGKKGEDWDTFRLGAEHYSLMPLINAVRGWVREVQNLSAIEAGEDVPSRTPAASIAQVLQQGMQQPLAFLRNINAYAVRMLQLDFATRQQFEPLGQILPTRDRRAKAIVDVPFRLPVGDVAQNFRVALTAVDEALAAENDQERLTMVLNLWQQYSNFVAQIAAPMQQMTDAQRKVAMVAILGGQKIMNEIIRLMRTDNEDFDFLPEVEKMMQEAESAMQAMGGQGAVSGAGAGAVAGGPSAPAEQSGLSIAGGPPPETGAFPTVQ